MLNQNFKSHSTFSSKYLKQSLISLCFLHVNIQEAVIMLSESKMSDFITLMLHLPQLHVTKLHHKKSKFSKIQSIKCLRGSGSVRSVQAVPVSSSVKWNKSTIPLEYSAPLKYQSTKRHEGTHVTNWKKSLERLHTIQFQLYDILKRQNYEDSKRWVKPGVIGEGWIGGAQSGFVRAVHYSVWYL